LNEFIYEEDELDDNTDDLHHEEVEVLYAQAFFCVQAFQVNVIQKQEDAVDHEFEEEEVPSKHVPLIVNNMLDRLLLEQADVFAVFESLTDI